MNLGKDDDYVFYAPYSIGTYLENLNDHTYCQIIEYRFNKNGLFAIILTDIFNKKNEVVVLNSFDLMTYYKKANKIIIEKKDGTKQNYVDMLNEMSLIKKI